MEDIHKTAASNVIGWRIRCSATARSCTCSRRNIIFPAPSYNCLDLKVTVFSFWTVHVDINQPVMVTKSKTIRINSKQREWIAFNNLFFCCIGWYGAPGVHKCKTKHCIKINILFSLQFLSFGIRIILFFFNLNKKWVSNCWNEFILNKEMASDYILILN